MRINNYKYLSLLGVYFFYSLITIIMKYFSKISVGNYLFYLGLGLIFTLFFIYAIMWQQILKIFELSTAFAFKGSTIIFTLFLSNYFYGEIINFNNIIGVLLIIFGIMVVSRYE